MAIPYYTISDILSTGENGDFIDFLKSLIEYDDIDLSPEALGVTKLVISKGLNSLSEKQKLVFQEYVLRKYTRQFCENCSGRLSWDEMFEVVVESDGDCECQNCKRIWEKCRWHLLYTKDIFLVLIHKVQHRL
jgi:hypothetical protein